MAEMQNEACRNWRVTVVGESFLSQSLFLPKWEQMIRNEEIKFILYYVEKYCDVEKLEIYVQFKKTCRMKFVKESFLLNGINTIVVKPAKGGSRKNISDFIMSNKSDKENLYWEGKPVYEKNDDPFMYRFVRENNLTKRAMSNENTLEKFLSSLMLIKQD